MQPTPLPDRFTTAPFRVRAAEDDGVTRNRLRAKDLYNSVWGVRSTARPQSLVDRCALFTTRLSSEAFFSHSTAALLMGAPLEFRLELAEELHIAVPAPARAPHAKGLRGHALSVVEAELATVDGLKCTSAARTWCDLAPLLSLGDLVAVGDHFVNWQLPFTSVEELAGTLSRHPRMRGRMNARAAIPLLDGRAESRPESKLRVICRLGGLPHPHINHRLVMTDEGGALRPDFEFTAYKTLLEYQGDYHRTKAQWRKDMTRRSRLEAQGWVVIEINADDLRDPAELVRRIGTFLRRQGWTGR